MRVSIAPNPSHLEAVSAVVMGLVRAEQSRLPECRRRRVMGLILHGDAAFAGQGLVAECLQMSNVPGTYHPPCYPWACRGLNPF